MWGDVNTADRWDRRPSAAAELEKKQNKLDKIIADFIDSEESNEVLKKAMKSTIEKLQTEIDELEYKYRIALKSSSTLDVLKRYQLANTMFLSNENLVF